MGYSTDLGAFGRCSACGAYEFLGRHRCPTIWQVRRPDEDEDWCDIRAVSAEDAAIGHAARNSTYSEYGEVTAQQVIEVRQGEETDVMTFEIYGELVPSYSSRQVANRES